MQLQIGKIEGLDWVAAQLRKLENPVSWQEERRALMPAARVVRESIRSKAPVGTKPHNLYAVGLSVKGKKAGKGKGKVVRTLRPGNLKRAIIVKTVRQRRLLLVGPNRSMKRASIGYYAYMLEYGTAYQPAQPFIRPGFESARPQAEAELKRAYENLLIKKMKNAGW